MELRILENMTKNNSTDLKQNILDTMRTFQHSAANLLQFPKEKI